MKYARLNSAALIAATVTSFILLSPKWTIPPLAWFAPALLLLVIKDLKPWKAFVVAFSVLFVSGLIGNYRVFPFPLIFLVPLTLQISITGALPYFIATLFTRRLTGWSSTIIFPSLAVGYEYLSSFGGGGTLGSIGYTQADNIPLVQIASVTGIWGISFLVYWFSAILVWLESRKTPWSLMRVPITWFAIVYAIVIIFGALRSNEYFERSRAMVRAVGITAWNVEPLRMVYEDAFNSRIDLNPETLTQTSPELAELNKALAIFIENPFDPKFKRSHQVFDQFQDSIFLLAQKEATAGAGLIVFSEALMFTVKSREDKLIQKAKDFSASNKVHIVLSLASFIPGKIEPGKKFIENKAVLINSSGEIESIFFKNKPVPVVEASIAGDGEIPVTKTGFGRIATSICYDADFPNHMRKAGLQKADIMVLPSGDWKEISPMHGNVARVRAVENGFSLIRPVSGATSIASDYYGRKIAEKNFYDPGEKILVAYLPVKGKTTLYALAGDVLPQLCLAYTLIILASSMRRVYFGSGSAANTPLTSAERSKFP